jgi:hypothetical protein
VSPCSLPKAAHVTDSGDQARNHTVVPGVAVDELDELLGDPVVYAPGEAPPAEAPVFVHPGAQTQGLPASHAEPRVSPVFWAAAIVWNVFGGLGGWLILRKTHPRTARRLLAVGVVSLVVIGGLIAGAILAFRAANPSYIYLQR